MPFIYILYGHVNIQFTIRKTGGNETYGGKTIREILTNLMQGSADYNNEIVDILTNPDTYWFIHCNKTDETCSSIELDTPIDRMSYQNIYINKRTKKCMIQCFLSDIEYRNLESQDTSDIAQVEQYYKNADMAVITIPEIICSIDQFNHEIAEQLHIDKSQILRVTDYECNNLYIKNMLTFVSGGYNRGHIWYIQINGFKSSKKDGYKSVLEKYTSELIETLKESDEIKGEVEYGIQNQYEPFSIDLAVKQVRDKIDNLINTYSS